MIFKYDLTLKKSHCIGWDGEGWIYDDDEEINIEDYEYEVSEDKLKEQLKEYENIDNKTFDELVKENYDYLKDDFYEEAKAKAQEELDEGWIY